MAAHFRLLPVDNGDVDPDLPFRGKEFQQQLHVGDEETLRRIIRAFSHELINNDVSNGLSELCHE